MADYGVTVHTRKARNVSGATVKRARRGGYLPTGETVHLPGESTIMEVRVDGVLRTVTVLDGQGRARLRLDGQTARY